MAKRQIVGGGFQDAAGNTLNLGSLRAHLTVDGHTASEQISASKIVVLPLDASGNINGTQYLWPNDQLTPAGTKYVVTAYNAQGEKCWGPSSQTVPTAGGTFDLTTWVPGE